MEINDLYMRANIVFNDFKENKIDLIPFHNISKNICSIIEKKTLHIVVCPMKAKHINMQST